MTERFANVAVLNGSPQRRSFTYAVPTEWSLRRGDAVVVPWRSQWAIGIVLAVTDQSDISDPRPIERILPPSPMLSDQQVELAQWLADYYLAPISACVSLFLPPGAPTRPRRSPERFHSLIPARPTQPTQLGLSITDSALEQLIKRWPGSKRSRHADLIEALLDGPLDGAAAAKLIGGPQALQRWLARTSIASADAGAISLSLAGADARAAMIALRRTGAERRQLSLIRLLAEGGAIEARAARRQSSAKASDIETLHAQGLITLLGATEPPLPQPIAAPSLTNEQATAADAIISALKAERGQSLLLHGVTGSGKTEVYLAACQHVMETGGAVIVLAPEIALAPQTIARFEARFPGQVAVRHSALTRSDAREQWRQAHAGEKRILVGARSALFVPMPKLRLVIVDEEHEWTYKQTDPQPRYHARTVARELAQRAGVVTVFGSATPDLTTMAAARQGSLRLLSLSNRIQSHAQEPTVISPPTVDVVDMREELSAGVRSVFSRALDAAISHALADQQQVLLFLNRRGMSAMVCRACGEAMSCRRCSVAMTLHRPGPYLQCHECGERQAVHERCPSCGETRIGAMSFGTAQLEAELKRRWGEIPITRWDRDTTARAGSHGEILKAFSDGQSRVLIGTQMIAKGLDLPRVTVAGIINADLSLRESDYTAAERTFQLLSQVAGRAGRGASGGRVIIQTYSPDHYAVTAAAAHDYEAFYQREARLRATLDYPPFGNLARLTVARSSERDAKGEAGLVADQLNRVRQATPGSTAQVIGPAPASPVRRRGLWRYQLLLKGDNPTALLVGTELGRGWSVDVDPVD